MEISLIDPAWHKRFLEQLDRIQLTDEYIKQLYSEGLNSGDQPEFIRSEKTAIIPITGALSKSRNFFYSLFSGRSSTYDGIVQGVQSADSDDSIESIELRIDSPGGNWIGLTEAVNAIAGAKKPVKAIVTGMATSAAYVLASQADEIESTNDGNDIGGLGVITYQMKWDGEKAVRSSNAPKKNPDAFTTQGEKDLKAELDEIESKAFKMVSEGRSSATGKAITEEVIAKDFGQGASMLADKALKNGLIDKITPAPARVSNAKPAAQPGKGRKLQQEPGRGSGDDNLNRGKKMELSELLREHPELCAKLVDQGRAEVWDQVQGHVTMAEATGAHELCITNLKGKKLFGSAEVQAGYMAAGMNRKDLQDREEDNPESDLNGDVDTELSSKQKEDDFTKKVLERSTAPVKEV